MRKRASFWLYGSVTTPHELVVGAERLRGTSSSEKWPPLSSPVCSPSAADAAVPSGPNHSGDVKNGCSAHSSAPLPIVKS